MISVDVDLLDQTQLNLEELGGISEMCILFVEGYIVAGKWLACFSRMAA